MTSKGLYLGRFQPFHNGHLEVIKNSLKEVDELIIVIGVAPEMQTEENPFSSDEVRRMLESVLKQEGLLEKCKVYEIKDIPDDDEYVEHVKKITGDFDIVYVCTNKLNERLFSEKGYEVKLCERFFDIEATKIRENIKNDDEWRSLVPEVIEKIIDEIGIERIKNL